MYERKMSPEELSRMQSYPLELKIAKTRQRIREWVRYFGESYIYISFSGGKDSTVLLDIARKDYPNMKAVFCDTGLEHPEIKAFVKTFNNVEIIRPTKSFKQVIEDYGYPIVSKEQSHYIYEVNHIKSKYLINKRLNTGGSFSISRKWLYLLDAPFEISDRCCYHLKKSPFGRYYTKTKRVPMTATLASESILRYQSYLRTGCNNYEGHIPQSKPMGFWTENDVLKYIKLNNLPIASCYGEIIDDGGGRYHIEGLDRTGCIFCAYGVHREECPNRYHQLKERYPELYDYCINGGEYNAEGKWQPSKEGLGFGKVLDYIGVKYD